MNEIMTPHQSPVATASPRGEAMTRTPEIIGGEIRQLTYAARSMTVYFAVEIGRKLAEAKELVPRGGWLDWLKAETDFSQPTANRYMQIYTEYGADQVGLLGAETKYSTLNNLSVSNALRLLAVPEEERESFAAEVDAEHLSTRKLEKAIAERDEAIRRAEEERAQFEASEKLRAELAEKIAGTRTEIEAANRKIRELESRPVEVAVSEPDPEEIERRAKEMADSVAAEAEQKIRALEAEAAAQKSDYDEKIRKLSEKANKDREELKQRIKDAEEKVAEAGAGDRAEAEKAKAEAEALRKQLSMSGAEMTVFKLRFGEWQAAYKAMRDALECVAEEQRERCAAAIKAQIDGWASAPVKSEA